MPFEFTPEQLDTLKAPLEAKRVKQRESGRGASLSYLETHDVIRMANALFGFGKWGSEIVELRPLEPVVVHNRDQKAGVQVGYVCVLRLTVYGCMPMSGVGYGDAVEYRESAPVTAHELAAKEAESDALKRALKNYGDQFGLALYSKSAGQDGHIDYDSEGGVRGAPAQADGASPVATVGASQTLGGWTWPFGKNVGKTLAETPEDYLAWFVSNGKDGDVKDRVRAFLNESIAA